MVTKVNASQIGYVPAGTGAVPTTVQSKLRETVSVLDFGAKGDGSDATNAFLKAIASIDISGGRGGAIYVPAGAYVLSDTINVPPRVKIIGAGSRATIINSNHVNVAFRFEDTDLSGLYGMRIAIGTTSATAVAIEIYSNMLWCQWNNFEDLEIVGNNIAAGQIGIWQHSRDETTSVVYNDFSKIRIFQMHKPVVITNYNEANVWRNLHINGFGIDANDPAVDFVGNACFFYGVWLGKGASAAPSLVGFSYSALNCVFDAIGDIGTGYVFKSKNGVVVEGVNQNQFRATGTLGVTAEGDILRYPVIKTGTWTPIIQGTSSAGAGTYESQQGTYTKMGDRVMFDCTVSWTAHTGTGNLRLIGLPFLEASSEPQVPVWVMPINLTVTGQAALFIPSSQNYADLYAINNGSVSQIAMDASATLRIGGMYRTDS